MTTQLHCLLTLSMSLWTCYQIITIIKINNSIIYSVKKYVKLGHDSKLHTKLTVWKGLELTQLHGFNPEFNWWSTFSVLLLQELHCDLKKLTTSLQIPSSTSRIWYAQPMMPFAWHDKRRATYPNFAEQKDLPKIKFLLQPGL